MNPIVSITSFKLYRLIMIVICYNEINRLASHEGWRSNNLLRDFKRGGVAPMDIISILMLMVSFGMLIAFIMSDKTKK